MKLKPSWSAIKADFDMDSVTEVYFWKSEWERFDPHDHNTPVSLCYYFYRFLYMAWFIGALAHNFACMPPNGFYLLFLTNLTFLLQFIYSILFFLYVSYQVCRKRRQSLGGSNNNTLAKVEVQLHDLPYHEEGYELPIVCKVLWMLHNILNNVPYIVTMIYWGILFKDHKGDERVCETLVNVFTHGLNSPLALLEALVVAIPIRRTHMIFSMIAGLVYSLYSLLYEIFGGDYPGERNFIYPILDWRDNPGLAVGTCVGVIFIGTVIIHCIMSWGVYRLRIYLKSKCTKMSDVYVIGSERGRSDYGGTGTGGGMNPGFESENKNYHF